MAGQSYIGITIYVAAELPDVNAAAGEESPLMLGFEDLDWVKIEAPVTGPQLGFTHNMIEIPDLESGRGTAVKGMSQGQDSTMTFRIDGGVLGTGQALVKSIADSPQGVASIRIVRGSGANNAPEPGDPVTYAQGLLHSYTENQADDSSWEGFSVGFRLNAEPVKGTIPSPS